MEALMKLARIPPAWLNQIFFEKVVKTMEKDPEAILEEFNVTPGSNPGDNFASAVFRASITFKSKRTNGSKTISTIIKVQPKYPPELAHLLNFTLFKTEIAMYEEVLSEISGLWKSVGDTDVLCPRLIYQSNEPDPVIILEDLSCDGFSVLSKIPEDFELSKRIVQRLAKFHASTFFLADEKKRDFTQFNFCLFKDPMTQGNIAHAFSAFVEVAKTWEGFEKFIPNLEAHKAQYAAKVSETYSVNTREFGFNVLNHGDFHLKNMLFKTDSNGTVDDFYFIDFQICNYSTPAIDLIYALYFSVSAENRQKHRAEIIATYYKQFVESLKKFGYTKTLPSLIDLQVEMLRNGNLEVLIAICVSIFFFIDLSKLSEMDPASPAEGMKLMYQAPGFKEIVLQELPRWYNTGFI